MITATKIPAELRNRNQWLLWKLIERSGDLPTKVPFQITGFAASHSDPTTWNSFAAVERRFDAGGFTGPGFVFSADDPFCGIDLDGCRDRTLGTVADWAREIIRSLDSYSEISPSGTGVKIWIQAKLPWSNGRKIGVADVQAMGEKIPAIEVYDHLRYFAITGQRLAVSPHVEPRQEQLDALLAKYFKPEVAVLLAQTDWNSPEAVIERARRYVAKAAPAVSGQGGHNAAFTVACSLVCGFGLSESDATGLFLEWNQTCQPPWNPREIAHKIKSAGQQSGPRNYLRDARELDYHKIRLPRYEEPRRPAEPPASKDMANEMRQRLAQIESGEPSLIRLGIPEVNWAIGGGVSLGEMVVLAARPNHGKTAIALQCVHNASDQGLPCLFVTEEMSAQRLANRSIQWASDVAEEYWPTSLPEVRRHVEEHIQGRAAVRVVESTRVVEATAETIRREVAAHGVKFIVVDYAQHLSGAGKSRYEQTTNVSIVLRQITTEENIVLLLLCQMNREILGRDTFLPRLSDIKDTGQIEQDADVILFSCWPHRINAAKNPPDQYQIFVAKNRNRAINADKVEFVFKPARQMFIENEQTNREPAFDHYQQEAF